LLLTLLAGLDRLRRAALPAAVCAAAALAAAVWLGRDPAVHVLYQILPAPPGSHAVAGAPETTPRAPATAVVSLEDAQLGELAQAALHHEAILVALSAEVGVARAGWSRAQDERFERAARAARAAITSARGALPAPGADRRVLSAYRAAIALHTRALAGGAVALAGSGGWR
jgi:hypothetical protein